MYQYGISMEIIKEKFPTAFSFSGSIRLGTGTLSNFPSDCGALLLSGSNYVTKQDLQSLMTIASMTGHNKIFATIVMSNKNYAEEQKRMFVSCGWQVIHEGKSNRTSSKTDIVLFYHNPDCIKKGY